MPTKRKGNPFSEAVKGKAYIKRLPKGKKRGTDPEVGHKKDDPLQERGHHFKGSQAGKKQTFRQGAHKRERDTGQKMVGKRQDRTVKTPKGRGSIGRGPPKGAARFPRKETKS